MTTKRIPIRAAKQIAREFGQDQVILLCWDRQGGLTHVVTYGKTIEDCKQAADGGNRLKRVLGWPERLCHAQPARAKPTKVQRSCPGCKPADKLCQNNEFSTCGHRGCPVCDG